MVVVIPAGAQIPPQKPPNPSCRNLENSSYSTDTLREMVGSFVSTLDEASACSTLLYTLNIESVLPPHLNQEPTPREIGVVKFSLDLGVLDQKYHSFIDPGSLPRGFMHEAQFHSETHKIPVLDFQEKTTDCKSVYNDIINFIDSTNVVYTHSNLVTYTQEGLDWIAGSAETKPRRKLIVLPLESLSSELILLATGEISSSLRLRDELRPQILEHVTHIGCDYHAIRDLPICALSTSHRQAVATHGLLQKYFWNHLTKLALSPDPTPRILLKKSMLHSFEKCSLAESDSSHSNHGTPHKNSQPAERKLSPDKQSSRTSGDSDDDDSVNSVFTLPEIFQSNETQISSRTNSENKHFSNSQPLRRPQCSRSDHTERQTNPDQCSREQTVQQTRTNSSPSPQTQTNKQTQESDNILIRRVGLGRGFLKTAYRTPPRKPNS
ncbi:protein maelstrom homolog [Bolinopsis microptera]|uniref:protein maelstrom homolog n=1 Tax=Bolinopsis microptera TaxID=2820187 RepID=UPI00307A9D41